MAEPNHFDKPRFCSRCGKAVTVEGAAFCKECGSRLDQSGLLRNREAIDLSPIIAFVLTVIPGLGHVYQGRIGAAIGWFFGVLAAYHASPGLGLIIQLVCAANAAGYSRRRIHRLKYRAFRDSGDRASAPFRM